MKVLLMIACLFLTSVSNGQTAVVTNPNTGKSTVVHKNQNGVTTAQTSGTVKTTNGATVAQGPNSAAAVNQHTGNAAVAHTNSNGVTTTQTTNGGRAKTKNGMGVAQGPGGTTCVKGRYQQGCKK